ncbi:pentapeptide repeat-containing protein [Microbispora hainanensis]|uniref:pentapeptide repeat-containing protein n=1 Tax=Microbispora hainanensis TaxID=568844 RepID=UPI0033EF6D98
MADEPAPSGTAASEAELSEAELSEAELSEAELSEAELSEAELSEAGLTDAGASLAGALTADSGGVSFRAVCAVGFGGLASTKEAGRRLRSSATASTVSVLAVRASMRHRFAACQVVSPSWKQATTRARSRGVSVVSASARTAASEPGARPPGRCAAFRARGRFR